MQYELSARAETDIQDIIRYTFENFGRRQVDRYIDGLFNTFDIVIDNPRMGSDVIGVNARRYVYRSHYVFYQVRDDVIRIAHIRHVMMGPPSLVDVLSE